jgi:hypothetical protein
LCGRGTAAVAEIGAAIECLKELKVIDHQYNGAASREPPRAHGKCRRKETHQMPAPTAFG